MPTTKERVLGVLSDANQARDPNCRVRHVGDHHVLTPRSNLVAGLGDGLLEDFRSGSGNELEGDSPKFCALHSSSALAANSFGLLREQPGMLELAGIGGFTRCRFEEKLPTGLGGAPPNLDFVARGPAGVVAVESKFTEPLTGKPAKFADSYDEKIRSLAEPAWAELYRSLREDPRRYRYLDAAQLLKHYLGIRNSLAGHPGDRALLYAYWEPTNAGEMEEFRTHREEVADFTSCVTKSDVRFVAMTHAEIWAEWEVACPQPQVLQHLKALRHRYELAI